MSEADGQERGDARRKRGAVSSESALQAALEAAMYDTKSSGSAALDDDSEADAGHERSSERVVKIPPLAQPGRLDEEGADGELQDADDGVIDDGESAGRAPARRRDSVVQLRGVDSASRTPFDDALLDAERAKLPGDGTSRTVRVGASGAPLDGVHVGGQPPADRRLGSRAAGEVGRSVPLSNGAGTAGGSASSAGSGAGAQRSVDELGGRDDSDVAANPFVPLAFDGEELEANGPSLPSAHHAGRDAEPSAPAPKQRNSAADNARKQRKRMARRRAVGKAFKLLIVLALLAGAAAAAWTYGRPYLESANWSDEALPYAQAIESVDGVSFVEPVDVVGETPAVLAARRADALLGDVEQRLPLWRSLGLATGAAERADLDPVLAAWTPALYAPTDGVVYHDSSLAGSLYDGHVTNAMALALLDQRDGWVGLANSSGVDAGAVVAGRAEAAARALQLATDYSTPLGSPDVSVLDALPAIVHYRLLAPLVFAEVHDVDVASLVVAPAAETEDGEAAGSAAADAADAGGPASWIGELPAALDRAPAPLTTVNDAVSVSGPYDRALWFLVFASFLEPDVAAAASEAISGSTVAAPLEVGGCTFATFTAASPEGLATVEAAVNGWVANVPAAFAAETMVLADGTVQLKSCDPGVGYLSGARTTAVHELLADRTAVQAAIAAVERGDVTLDRDAAIAAVRASGVGVELASLVEGVSPKMFADLATDRVLGVLSAVEPQAD